LPRFEGDKMVYVSAEAYATIVLYSTRYANDGIPRNRWNEIYGILIGKVSDGIIFVNRAEPMTVGHSVDVQLGPEHYVFISQIQDDLEKDGKGEYMVGWFHSHPGLTLFYSYTDLMNHLNFQTVNPDFVGIVFDPIYIKEKPGHPGIVMYRLNDTMMDVESAEFENNYHEMRYRIIGLNLPFLSHTLLRASNNYGKGLPLQLSYGEKLNPQSVPIKTIKAQDTDTPKTVAPQAQQQAAQERPATGGQKAISSIQSVPAKSSSKITIKRADNVSQISKIESAKGKEDFEKEILSIKDLQERGLKYFLEAKKLFYLKNFDSSLALFKQAFNSFKEYGENATQVYLKSVNEAFELFFKEDIFTVAHELAELLVSLAEEFGSMFYLGVGQQFLGELKIKKGKLEEGIDYLDQATVVFAKLPDYAGAGYANYLIGETYFKNSEWDHSALYYVEAISNFNQIKGHSDFYQQRKDVWATLSNIKKMISNIQTKLGELKPKITDQRVLDKIEFAMKN
jgi:tetratricopeptide (TPR) repeat protein